MKIALVLMGCAMLSVFPARASPGCPKTLGDWKSWRDQAISELLQPRFSAEDGATIDFYEVMAGSVAIDSFIDDCYASFSPSSALDAQIGNLRKFTSNLTNNLSIPEYNHQFGYTLNDFEYLEFVRDAVDLPDLLKSPTFLRKISSPATYRAAFNMIEEYNKTLPSDKQWTVLIYKSRFLTTPDKADTFGRFFILVPGDKYDKWIQFGIKLPTDSTLEPVNNLSIVSIAKADNQGRRFNALIDWWRTYNNDGTISLEPRRISQGVTENCVRCHKTSPLGIHPAQEFIFARNGTLMPNTVNAGAIPSKLNSLIMTYGAPYFNRLADTTAYGPPLGQDIQRSDDFMSYCTQGLDLDQRSVTRIKQNMSCTDCHSEKGPGAVGLLNFPETTNISRTPDNQIYQYLSHGWMPPSEQLSAADRGALDKSGPTERAQLYKALINHQIELHINLTPNEREGLYQCLMKEYFDIDRQTGTLVDWLRNNSAPFSLLNVSLNSLKRSPSVKALNPHD